MPKETRDIFQEGTSLADATPSLGPPRTPEAIPLSHEEKKQKRTFGLKAFDVFLYPVLANSLVFALSVTATYLTTRGGDRHPSTGRLIFGKTGEFFQKRGDWLMEKFKRLGMSHDQADMSKMVFFSFADGSLVAPLVKLVEDKREKIGLWIDRKMGTVPRDKSVYDAEPEQSWLSVLGGRLATFLIVMPTAVALDRIKIKGKNLNDRMFRDPGKSIGEWVARKPGVAKHFGPLKIPELSSIGLFEIFYTSLCTGGLYLSSRALASWRGRKHYHFTTPADSGVVSEERPDAPVSTPSKADESLKSKPVVESVAPFGERELSRCGAGQQELSL